MKNINNNTGKLYGCENRIKYNNDQPFTNLRYYNSIKTINLVCIIILH